MMRSLFSGVSGIKVHQTRMDVIGNNIANINTIGFKSSRTTFSDMLSQLQSSAAAPTESGLGGINAKQIGLGVNVESIDIIFTDSSPQQTGKNTDLALSGNGLFVLKNGAQSYYTRNGAFMFDESGYYVMPGSGLRVQGWNAVDGSINTNGTATDIVVPVGKTMEASATKNIEYSGNLDKESLIITAIQPIKSTSGDLSKVATYSDYTTAISFQNTAGETVPVNITTDEVLTAGSTVDLTTSSTPSEYTVTLETANGEAITLTSGNPFTSTTEVDDPYPLTVTDVDDTTTPGSWIVTLTDADGNEFEFTTTTNPNLAVGDNYNAEATNTPSATATYTVTYTDSNGNVVYTESGVAQASLPAATVTADVTADSTGKTYSSINVDTTNALGATITLSDGTTRNVSSGYYEVGKSIPITTLATVYDSLGGQHQVTVLIDKDSTTVDENLTDAEAIATARTDSEGNQIFDNRWRAYIAPSEGQQGPAANVDADDETNYVNSYTRTEADGSTTVGEMSSINYIYFSDTGQFISNGQDNFVTIHFEYSNGNGAAVQDSALKFDGMTQYANSTTASPVTDGNSAGVRQSLSIDGEGIISGTYTNGLVQQEAQIAVAQFSNSGGLTKVGTTIYQESNNSGLANVKTIADFGLNVVSSALEMSNVDLATEFSDMIITQRGFQANSKVTTVSDEMLETLVNMKR